ncbi:MAG TPA: hypothetical protein VIP48_02720 [Streptosporangiaceae bacterium]
MDTRPLTESERARLRETLAPVLRDIDASGAIAPHHPGRNP